MGAYGDNRQAEADRLGAAWGFGRADLDRLRRLGDLLNYNAYGEEPIDVRIQPHAL